MKVRFLKMWRGKKIGSTHDLPDGVADLLIRRHICELHGSTSYETAAMSAPPVKRGRGRPRKCVL